MAQKQASLLGLPTELRQHIYDQIFGCDQRWVIYHIHGYVYDIMTPNYLPYLPSEAESQIQAMPYRRGKQERRSRTQKTELARSNLPNRGAVFIKRADPGSLGIMRTCKQIYEEASTSLYASAKITACIRPPVAKAWWLKQSISLGLVQNVFLWRFVRDLELTVELDRKADVHTYLARISGFIQAMDRGKKLRKLKLVMQFREDEAMPVYTEQVIEVLTQFQVAIGEVTVYINSESDDGDDYESTEMIARMKEAIIGGRNEGLGREDFTTL